MYTIVNYLYRDASNYKRLNQVCFLGTLSEHQKARIIGSLYEGEYFIPSAIGWDEERISADYNDDDGCWFELTKDDFFEEVDNLINKDDVILVKASRGMRFEEVISKLKELK